MLDTDFKPLNKRLKKQRTVLKSICDIIFQALKRSEVTVHSLDSSLFNWFTAGNTEGAGYSNILIQTKHSL